MNTELNHNSLSSLDWFPAVDALALSRQHRHITIAIMVGKCDKQIARELGIGFSTVRTYVDRIFRKLQVRDRSQLMLRVFATMIELGHPVCTGNDGDSNTDGKPAVMNNAGLKSISEIRHSTGRARCAGRAGTVPIMGLIERRRTKKGDNQGDDRPANRNARNM